MAKNIKPMKKSILRGTTIFILLLCGILSAVQYKSNKAMLYSQYESSIGSILRYTATEIDADDLAECIRTGVKSPKYDELQTALDKIKEQSEIHFIYVIVPLNAEPIDNVKNVIAGATQYEYEFEADELVQLNSLTGDSYSAETAQNYLDAYNSGVLSFFEASSEWGTDYTGLLPLFDSNGDAVAALCVDVDTAEIQARLRNNMIEGIVLVSLLGVMFIFIFFTWMEHKISDPIEQLETSVVEFASQCRNQKDPEALEIEVPPIHTNNEVEMLADAVSQMSKAIREYVKGIVATERKLAKVSMMVNKDALTEVRNKNAFDAFVRAQDEKIRAGKAAPFALVIADLNELKKVNESCGHTKGDLYIKKGCHFICEVFSHSPVFRISGDEFAVIMMGQAYDERTALVKQAQGVFQDSERDESLPLWERCSAAIGITAYQPGEDRSFEAVFNRAEENMYQEKARMKAQ